MSRSPRSEWFLRILERRFGVDFRLERIGHEWSLTVPGEGGWIRMPIREWAYPIGTSDVSCDTVDTASLKLQTSMPSQLYVPGGASGSLVLRYEAGGVSLSIDLPTMTWWMLSRAEEVARPERDRHGRFPAQASHAWRYEYLSRPVVDEWLDILRSIAEVVWPGLDLTTPSYHVLQGHDVDRPSRYAFAGVRDASRRVVSDVLHRRWESAANAPWAWSTRGAYLHPRDAFNTFDLLMSEAERCGRLARFHFLVGVTDARYDGDYELKSPAIVGLIKRIAERGHTFGLHPSYGTCADAAALNSEVERFRMHFDADEVHSRMHYLRWEHPNTLRILAQAGVSHDYTLGYANEAGFRCGTCFQYSAYDPVDDKPLSVEITPLIFMDVSLLSRQYNHDPMRDWIPYLCNLVEACRRVGGCFSFLWHNSELDSPAKRDLFLNLSMIAGPEGSR